MFALRGSVTVEGVVGYSESAVLSRIHPFRPRQESAE
jgi:hypothetical protein